MKSVLIFLFCFTITTLVAQLPNNSKILGTTDSIYSKILKEERKIVVYTPKNASITDLSENNRYPVIYLLDPETHFNTISTMIKELSEGGTLPEVIIVGILNTDRTRDLTPSHVNQPFYHDKVMGFTAEIMKTSGGGENFTSFIEKELIPHIDSLYHTAPYRILIGHSFGGLMVLNTLFNHPTLFNAYIAIDAGLWWDNLKLHQQIQKNIVTKKFDNKTLFLGMANVKPVNLDTMQVRKDTTPYSLNMRGLLQFNDAVKKNKQTNLRYSSSYYDDDTHGSVPIIAAYDGLRFIFKSYSFQLPITDLNKINIDSAFTAHFNMMSKEWGYTALPPIDLVSNYAYYFLETDLPKAYRLFHLNVHNYPKNFYVYDNMGDYYSTTGEKQKAIEQYTKSLALFNSPETKAKLEKLKIAK